MPKCETCGTVFTEKDIGIVETAPVDYYPYEGEVYTIYCDKCGYVSQFTETDWVKP